LENGFHDHLLVEVLYRQYYITSGWNASHKPANALTFPPAQLVNPSTFLGIIHPFLTFLEPE